MTAIPVTLEDTGFKTSGLNPATKYLQTEIHIIWRIVLKTICYRKTCCLEGLSCKSKFSARAINILPRFQFLGISHLCCMPAVQRRVLLIVGHSITVIRLACTIIPCPEHLVIKDCAVPISAFVLSSTPILEGLVEPQHFCNTATKRNIMIDASECHRKDIRKSKFRI